jgi:hypothetical protein
MVFKIINRTQTISIIQARVFSVTNLKVFDIMKSIKLLQEVRAMKRFTLLGLGSIFLLGGSSKAGPLIDFEASIGAIQQKPKGYVSYEGVSDTDKIDVKNDAKLGDKTKPW